MLAGAAVQVATGAGLSVVCGPFLLLWLGPAIGVPTLLWLNLLVSVLATAAGASGIRWNDAALASAALLAGCAVAWALPPLSDVVLKAMTACVLLAIALPRPPVPGNLPSKTSAGIGVALASLVSGALTVWTATPGPIVPVAFARAGRSGSDIRRTMQPISIVGYGAALAWTGLPPGGVFDTGSIAWLAGAVFLGVGLGFLLRRVIAARHVLLLVRVIAAAAACLLFLSLLH